MTVPYTNGIQIFSCETLSVHRHVYTDGRTQTNMHTHERFRCVGKCTHCYTNVSQFLFYRAPAAAASQTAKAHAITIILAAASEPVSVPMLAPVVVASGGMHSQCQQQQQQPQQLFTWIRIPEIRYTPWLLKTAWRISIAIRLSRINGVFLLYTLLEIGIPIGGA